MIELEKIIVGPEGKGKRLDVFIAWAMDSLSREQTQRLIKEGKILLNGHSVKASTRVAPDDTIEIEIPEPIEWKVKAQKIPLDIVHEDKHIIVVNKASGMVTHPAPGHPQGTLVNALVYHCKDLTGIGGKLRPGLVHRLDKDTSGLLAVAKTQEAYASLVEQLQSREMGREYLTLVHGDIKEDKGTVEAPIGRMINDRKKFMVLGIMGKEAITHYQVLERLPGARIREDAVWLRVKLETGRTHQIRVHLAYLKHPVFGDPVYGTGAQDGVRLMLHAARLELNHPKTGKRMEFKAPLPKDMEKFLKQMRRRDAKA